MIRNTALSKCLSTDGTKYAYSGRENLRLFKLIFQKSFKKKKSSNFYQPIKLNDGEEKRYGNSHTVSSTIAGKIDLESCWSRE